ncbi:hypothetical protein N5C81_14995 [Rhizobium pusense]|uniref:hypothetical protein n=1 Tax=Agrobacterium pusense TaxID=648995 RepID=UPI00244D2C70|nr:hypothetical protein [Agrobacterium pusense]MDH1268930.1 hypothetical protein [Agrobacterium pusense]
MTSLDDRTIDGMSEDELRAALKDLRGRYALMHRRAQCAVPAKDRDGLRALADRWEKAAERRSNAWLREFTRVCSGHRIFRDLYELAAKKLGLPHGMYHSVSDLPFGRRGDGRIYANVYLSPQGGIETFDVVETVRKAITP